MASTGVRRSAPSLAGGRLGRRFHRGLPSWPQPAEWIAVGVAALVLGLVTARVASSRSSNVALFLLAALIPFVLMIARDVRRLLLLLVIFDTAFQLDKNFNYNDQAAKLGAIGGLSASVTTIALAGLYAMWFAERMTRRTAVNRGTIRLSLPLIVYVGITALSTLVAGERTLAGFEDVLLVQTLLLFIYVVGTVQTRADVRFIAIALVVSLFAEAVVTLALPFLGSRNILGISTYVSTGTNSGGGPDSRFGGTIGSPNTAASFFALLIAPTLVLVLVPVARRIKAMAVGASAFATLALILTLSRGGWIAFAISVTFLVVIALRRGWMSPRVPIACVIGMTLLVLPFSGRLAARITGNDHGSAASRIPLMHLAENVIHDHPVLGVGANNLGVVFPKYAGPQYDRAWIYTVHNKYLLTWAESGIGALVAFLWFLFSTVRRGWRVWQTHDDLLSPIALGLTAGFIGEMVHMSVDVFQNRAQIQSLWIVAALIAATDLIRSRELDRSKQQDVGNPGVTHAG